jgi:hypothetical protein
MAGERGFKIGFWPIICAIIVSLVEPAVWTLVGGLSQLFLVAIALIGALALVSAFLSENLPEYKKPLRNLSVVLVLGLLLLAGYAFLFHYEPVPAASAASSVNLKTNNGVVTQNQSGGTNIGQQNFIGTARFVAISRDCRQAQLPFSIAPNTSEMPIYVLNIHPKTLDNPNGWVPEMLQNGSDKPISWPPRAVATTPKHAPCCDFSTYRCDFENIGEVPFLSVRVEFLVMYPKQALVDPHHKTFVVTKTLDPKQTFSVYLINASHQALYCYYPIAADVQLLGETGYRNIPVQSSNATFLDQIQFATLMPGRFKWAGLP